MEQHNYTLLLTKITCITSSAEGGHDDVYLRIYPNGDVSSGTTYFYGSPIKMKGQASDDAVRYLDISINATYLSSLLIKVWDKDDGGNEDDLLATITINRDDPLEGSRSAKQTTGQMEAEYQIDWRVIDKPIPTLRVLGVKCEKSSAGCNEKVVNAVIEVASQAADAAARAIGKVKTPKAMAISKGFKAASDVIEAIGEVATWIANAAEGDDDVYLQHVDPNNPDDRRGAFCPPADSNQRCIKMNEKDPAKSEVAFIERYGQYFRFPLDRGDVTIQLREGDRDSTHVSLGSLTIGEAEWQRLKDEGATVQVASEYLVGTGNGQGAIYHLAYSVALEDWANPPVPAEESFSPSPDTWGPFNALGGSVAVTSAPALTVSPAGDLNCFFLGESSTLWCRWRNADGSWAPGMDLGGTAQGAPAAVQDDQSRINVGVRGTNNHLWIRSREADGTWNAWKDLGGWEITAPPAIASWAAGRLDCFVRGSSGELGHIVYQDGGWSNWESLGGGITGAPAAASWGPNRIDVVVRGADDLLWHRAWTGSVWTAWANLGGAKIASSPTICSRAPGTLDVFATRAGGVLLHRKFGGGAWTEWYEVRNGGVIKETPSAAHTGGGRLEVVARGTDGKLWITKTT